MKTAVACTCYTPQPPDSALTGPGNQLNADPDERAVSPRNCTAPDRPVQQEEFDNGEERQWVDVALFGIEQGARARVVDFLLDPGRLRAKTST